MKLQGLAEKLNNLVNNENNIKKEIEELNNNAIYLKKDTYFINSDGGSAFIEKGEALYIVLDCRNELEIRVKKRYFISGDYSFQYKTITPSELDEYCKILEN